MYGRALPADSPAAEPKLVGAAIVINGGDNSEKDEQGQVHGVPNDAKT